MNAQVLPSPKTKWIFFFLENQLLMMLLNIRILFIFQDIYLLVYPNNHRSSIQLEFHLPIKPY